MNIKQKIKKQKLIDDFKRYIEIEYWDIIDIETIENFCNIFHKTDEEKEILKRRFNLI